MVRLLDDSDSPHSVDAHANRRTGHATQTSLISRPGMNVDEESSFAKTTVTRSEERYSTESSLVNDLPKGNYINILGQFPQDVTVDRHGRVIESINVGKVYCCAGATIISSCASMTVGSDFKSEFLAVDIEGTVSVGNDLSVDEEITVRTGSRVTVGGHLHCTSMVIEKGGQVAVESNLDVSYLSGEGSLSVGKDFTGGSENFKGEMVLKGNRHFC